MMRSFASVLIGVSCCLLAALVLENQAFAMSRHTAAQHKHYQNHHQPKNTDDADDESSANPNDDASFVSTLNAETTNATINSIKIDMVPPMPAVLP